MNTAESYFVSEIETIFNTIVGELNGTRIESLDRLCVRYEGHGWFIECYALPEDAPQYCPRVDIGSLPEIGILARDKQIDIMHTVPLDNYLSRYNLLWRYDNRQKMRESYHKVRDEIFVPFAVPLLQDRVALEALIRKQSHFLNLQGKREIEDHNISIIRRRASNAWQEKNFSIFLAEMEALPINSISKLDTQRIAFARKNKQ